MENERHYFTVGVFVLVGFLAMFAFAMWLTHRGKGEYEHFRIRFNESVSGLSAGSVVKFRGVSVGTVDTITIDPDDSRLIRVDISLLKSTPLKTDTKANLKMQGITGVVFIELSGGDPSLPNLDRGASSDKKIPEIPAQPSSINQIIDSVPILLNKLSATLDQVNKMVSDENIGYLRATLKNSDAASGDLQRILGDSQGNIAQASRDAATALHHLNNAASNADNLSQRLNSNPSSLLCPPAEKGIPAP